MLEALIKAIQDGVKTTAIEGYFTREVYHPPIPRTATPIALTTLSGVVDYLKNDIDSSDKSLFVLVESPTKVIVATELGAESRVRETLAIADCSGCLGRGFKYGTYLTMDQSIIDIQACFQDSEDKAKLLAHVGTLTLESTLDVDDDGTTQKTINKSGIARKREGALQNPLSLIPFSSFPEVDPVARGFVFRLKADKSGRGENGPIQFALFPSQDPTWQVEAIDLISQYLKQHLEGLDIPVLS